MSAISRERLNTLAVKKQCLDGSGTNVLDVVRRIGGLHATSPTTPYLALFARLKGFTIKDLDEELYGKRTMGRLRSVRKTVYIFPVDFMPVAFAATKRVMGLNSVNHCRYMGVTERDYVALSKRAMDLLKAGPMTAAQVKKALGTDLHVSSILNLMCDEGRLARGRPAGWRSNQHTYYPFNNYYPGIRLDSVPEEEAIVELVRRHLLAFGPVTENDIAWWTGLNKGDVRAALASLAKELIYEDNMILLRSDQRLLKDRKPESLTVSLLPSLDPYIMGYKDRDRYLNKEHAGYVFDRSGNATSTIVIDGRIAGVWDLDGQHVKVFLFGEIEEEILKKVCWKARDIGRFIMGGECEAVVVENMAPLARRTAGAVMAPLKGQI
jgi:DNA glycosylase AlkZ-like